MSDRLVLVLVLITLTALSQVLPASMGFQGMEENCILSFVVPKHKMKSSCELDAKVNRRINSMEMKVNIYKQKVAELQGQLEKQRAVTMEELDALERQVKESTVNGELSFLVERRLAVLEKNSQQLHEDLEKVKAVPAAGSVDQSAVFNALDTNPVALPTLVRSMVQAEVKTVMANFSATFQSYVQEQILLYNQVFNMMPRPRDESISSGRTFTSPPSLSSSEQIAKNVGNYVNDRTKSHTDTPNPKVYNDTDSRDAPLSVSLTNNSSLDIAVDDPSVVNASNSRKGPDHEKDEPYSIDKRNSQDRIIGKGVSSRISQGEDGNTSSEAEGGQDSWKENMIQDQQSRQAVMEERLRTNIKEMLYKPLAEVMSLIEKRSDYFEEKIVAQRAETQEATNELRSEVKIIDHRVQSESTQLDSLSRGFQDMSIALKAVKPLESVVQELESVVRELESVVRELEKNFSSGKHHGMSAHEMDERAKRVKKIERLITVYQQSMDHYRDETKLEYREIRARVDKEAKAMRGLSSDLESSVTATVNRALNKLNSSFTDEIRELREQVQMQGDTSVMLQMDITNVDRKIKGKASKSEREIKELKDSLRQVTNKHRDFRKRFDFIEQGQDSMGDLLNHTAKDIFALKTEVHLSVLDDWLPLTFDYDPSRTDCYGDQYVKRLPFEDARLVGVVLCSGTRYKIFLSKSLQTKFLNVGDSHGLGADHCEFVGARDEKEIRLSPFRASFTVAKGYSRNYWGEEPRENYLNSIRPSPHWYECGVKIP